MLNSNGLLNTRGLVVAVILMLLFTAINLAGAEFMSESNVIIVIWKTAVPFLAIGVIASLSFHPSNFTAGGGFMPLRVARRLRGAARSVWCSRCRASSRPSAWPARRATRARTSPARS